MDTLIFDVTGMTCGHCERSVTEEVGEVAGVKALDVSAQSGILTVVGHEVDPEAVVAAVEEAGYQAVAR